MFLKLISIYFTYFTHPKQIFKENKNKAKHYPEIYRIFSIKLFYIKINFNDIIVFIITSINFENF